MQGKLDNFILNKEKTVTVKNRLIPIGKTAETMKKYGLVERDQDIDSCQYEIKELIRVLVREHIDNSLGSLKLDFSKMFHLMNKIKILKEQKAYSEEEKKEKKIAIDTVIKDLNKERAELAKEISNALKSKKFANKNTVCNDLPELIERYDKEHYAHNYEIVNKVNDRQSVFTKFEQQIDSKFENKFVKGNVVYRLLRDNSEIFLNNNAKIMKHYDDYEDMFKEYGVDIPEEWGDYEKYSDCMTQKGIDKYNEFVGVINQCANEWCQKNAKGYSDYAVRKLQKQIYSLHDGPFVNLVKLEKDSQVLNLYSELISNINNSDIKTYVEELFFLDREAVYIKGNRLSKYSNLVYGDWNVIKNCVGLYLHDEYDKLSDKEKKKIEKERERKAKKRAKGKEADSIYEDPFEEELAEYLENSLSLSFIESVVDKYEFDLEYEVKKKGNVLNRLECLQSTFEFPNSEDTTLLKDDSSSNAELMKRELEKIIDAKNIIGLFDRDKRDDRTYDEAFLNNADKIMELIGSSHKIYDKIRNYITEKPQDVQKVKLYFDSSDFGGGWSKGIEDKKLIALFRKDGKKYFGVYCKEGMKSNKKAISPTVKTLQEHLKDKPDGDCYEKMYYNQTGDIKKALNKNILKAGCMDAPKHLIEGYDDGLHRRDINFLHELIDFYKEKISVYENWQDYPFSYKPTEEYTCLDEFVNDLQKDGYIFEWRYIDSKYIDDMIENEELLLFEIYNKDYAKGKTSNKKDSHTQYLDYLFSDENLKTHLIELRGNAEVFYREAKISNPYVHKKGTVMVNKRYKNGSPIGDNYLQIVNDAKNGIIPDNVTAFTAAHDYVKDKRYSEDMLTLHMTMTINKGVKEEKDVNERVYEYLQDNDVNVLAINRGVANLLYVTVVSPSGKVLHKESLNFVNKCDYKAKIDSTTTKKVEDCKDWKTIGSADDIKTGYITHAVRRIADLVLKYNAMVVMEDLSINIKYRSGLDNQVYAKFENALIAKLSNLYVIGNKADEDGGVLKPYYLCDPDIDIKKTKQNGFVVLAGSYYITLTDQNTGFVPLFSFASHRNATQKGNFIKLFDSFVYDEDEDVFKVSFNYANFNKTHFQNKWVCYSDGYRSVKNVEDNTFVKVKLTDYIKDLLTKKKLDYKDSHLLDVTDKKDVLAVYEAIRLIFQMNNNANGERWVISPVRDINGNNWEAHPDYNACLTLAKRGFHHISKILNKDDSYENKTDYINLYEKK